MASGLLKPPVMNTLRIVRLASLLLSFVISSSAAVAHAEANSTGAQSVLSVSATVLSKCSVQTSSTVDVACQSALPARVEQSAAYTVQIGGQQARFTTSTVNF
jgi:hypothetical protein